MPGIPKTSMVLHGAATIKGASYAKFHEKNGSFLLILNKFPFARMMVYH